MLGEFKLKKFLFLFFAFLSFLPVSSANDFQIDKKIIANENCQQKNIYSCKKEKNSSKNPFCEDSFYEKYKKHCDKCSIEDDEYCVYNECYLDKHFKKMKKALCLSEVQEECIDRIYKNFKIDYENYCLKYKIAKNRLLDLIECEHCGYKSQKKVVKEMRIEFKEKIKDYNDDIKQELCKKQKSIYRRFLKAEKRKMKKIIKYGTIYKFPCTNCCKLN